MKDVDHVRKVDKEDLQLVVSQAAQWSAPPCALLQGFAMLRLRRLGAIEKLNIPGALYSV